MDRYAEEFSDYIVERYNGVIENSKTKTATALFEQKLDFSQYVPEGFGTGDVVIISEGAIEVIDFKYGKGVPVSASNNPQMMLYALGAYCTFSLLYKFEKVQMTIYQPRLDRILTDETDIPALLKWADEELKEKALLAFEGGGAATPGDYCRFCAIRAVCRANALENLRLANYEYQHPDLLTDDEISDILLVADRLKSWVADVLEFALTEAVAGKKWRGFKLVEGRSNRKYTDEKSALSVLKCNGYKEDDITVTQLLSITAMEKLLTKPVFNNLLNKFVIKPQGKPTLVLESDSRPEFNQAALDFKDVEIEK